MNKSQITYNLTIGMSPKLISHVWMSHELISEILHLTNINESRITYEFGAKSEGIDHINESRTDILE